MRLVDQWQELAGRLPAEWREAELRLAVFDSGRRARAGALLGPLGAAGSRDVRLHVVRHGAGARPEALRRALGRLDAEEIAGRLELVAADEPSRDAVADEPATLAGGWAAALELLPQDWSDVWAEVQVTSSDFVEPAALYLAPINPTRAGNRFTLRFRSARRSGYGVSPEMVARAFERCDEHGITGEVRVLRVLSDTKHNATQGPVQYIGGKAV